MIIPGRIIEAAKAENPTEEQKEQVLDWLNSDSIGYEL